MIKVLRRRHVQTWTLLAILLPAGMLSALVARKQFPTADTIRASSVAVHPFLIRSVKLMGNPVQIRGNNASVADQLVWKNTVPLSVPSATLYLKTGRQFDVRADEYIGRIEMRGDYIFPLPANRGTYQLVVYDFIHKKVIREINIEI
jgi:hypothetical protein